MAEINRFSGCADWIELNFVERERTPSELMKLGIRLHLVGLSLSNTISELEKFGVQRSPKAVHDWVQKADLQPARNASPDQITLDETVIRVNGQQYWLYAVIRSQRLQIGKQELCFCYRGYPETNKFLHIRLFTTTTTALTQKFLQEIRSKHDVSEVVFLVDHAHHLSAALNRVGLRFQTVRHGNRNAVERVFRQIKQRTSSFSNSFSHVQPTTAETWLQAFAVWWNSLN